MKLDWKQPPGPNQPRNFRGPLRKIVTSFLVGVISVGVAWAGAGLVPINELGVGETQRTSKGVLPARQKAGAQLEEQRQTLDMEAAAAGQLLAGAAKVSLEPKPEAYGGTWVQDKEKCTTLPPNQESFPEMAAHVADFRVKWLENSNCIYMGGYGIGPMNPIVEWENEYGLYARSIALSDGKDTVVLTLIDGVYWEGRYNSMCANCGFLDLSEQLGSELGLSPDSFVFSSSHSHTSPDFIGGWGGVPRWYMEQATDALKDSVRQALAAMQPAVLETGEVIARQFNSERRDYYRSAEDDGLSWFRVIAADDQPTPETCTTPEPAPEEPTNEGNGNGYGNAGKATPAPEPTPICEPADPGTAIATVGAYAAHPVTADEGSGKAHGDYSAVFAKNVEDRFGGLGMFLQTGLGNMSPQGSTTDMGNGLASLIPGLGAGAIQNNPDVRVARSYWDQPVTNLPLGTLGAGGFFDRKFNEAPAAVREGKGSEENKKCTSASPISVDTSVAAAKIGSLWITGAPGETFSNFSNTIEERNVNGVTMALGLVNDGLGYLVQSFETDHVGRQGVGFAGKAGPVALAEYEDAYSIDHCFADAALEKTIRLLGSL